MKKIILSTICGAICLTLVGCSSSSDGQALKDLNVQLDRMENTVNSINTSAVYEVTPSSYLYTRENDSEDLKGSRFTTLLFNSQNALTEHEQLKAQIAQSCATLKATLKDKYKLSKNQVKALKKLTEIVSGYSADIKNTDSGIKNSTNLINQNKYFDKFNVDNLNLGYTTLNNQMQSRIALFSNVLNTLEQIENTLSCSRIESEQNSNNTNKLNNQTQEQTSIQSLNQENNSTNKKNIDTYLAPTNPNVYYQNTNQTNGNYYNRNCNNSCYQNGYYGYNNGIYPYYNNGYMNGGFYNNGFNTGRNTDTYLPRMRNIDTYRPIVPPVNNGIADEIIVSNIDENMNISEDEQNNFEKKKKNTTDDLENLGAEQSETLEKTPIIIKKEVAKRQVIKFPTHNKPNSPVTSKKM